MVLNMMNDENDSESSQSNSPDPLSAHPDVNEIETSASTELGSTTHERWTRLLKPRGRPARDPHAQSIRYQCRNADDMEHSLRDYLENPTVPAEHATLEFVFPMSAAFMVYAGDLRAAKQSGHDGNKNQHLYGRLDRTAISIMDALAPAEDSKEQMRRQKAIAKICVEACEKADGYRYSFHNNWLSREDEACRFSYFCNDSTLNKGRAASKAGDLPTRKIRKPIYDCQGLIAVKFSLTKQCLEVHYKHLPLHKTYAERAPPPRRDSKRRKLMEVFDPESLPVDKRKRKATLTQSPTPKKPAKRRITEPIAASTESGVVDLTRADSLQPLVEFLGSTDDAIANQRSLSNATSISQHGNMSEPPASSSRGNSTMSATDKTPTPKSRRSVIPGTMAGSVQNGSLSWSARGTTATKLSSRTPRKNSSRIPARSTSSGSVLLPGITDAASESDTAASIALSELGALKRKLEEAEARIRKLESEKTTTPSHPPTGPPQHVMWPVPPGYPPPYPPYHYPYPPPGSLPPPPPQYQAPPNQSPFQAQPQYPSPIPAVENRSQDANSTPPTAPQAPPSTSTTTTTPQRILQVPGLIRPPGTKFLFYQPRSSSTPAGSRAAVTASEPTSRTSRSAATTQTPE